AASPHPDGLASDEVKCSQIIETCNVICVSVGDQHSINPRKPRTQRLDAKLRSCINNDDFTSHIDFHRCSETHIFRVIRKAHFALTADKRNSCRSSRAQKLQLAHVLTC